MYIQQNLTYKFTEWLKKILRTIVFRIPAYKRLILNSKTPTDWKWRGGETFNTEMDIKRKRSNTYIEQTRLFFFLRFIYLKERERVQAGAGAKEEGEAGSLLSRKPDSGLDPRTLGSWPELNADS